MSTMNKETWTPWELIPKEAQNSLISDYKALLTSPNEKEREWAKGLEVIFGYNNLNPEPHIKTWEDVEKEYGDEVYSQWGKLGADITASRPLEKVIDKCVATIKIAKLIDLGYGGAITEEEWKDEEIMKFGVKWSYKANDWVYHNSKTTKEFIAFHTPEQREEFMSYESNRKLVELYFLL